MVENKKNKMKYYGSKTEVYNSTARYTKGGLEKKDIVRIDDGYGNYRYKSRRQQKKGRRKNSFIRKWAKAVKRARKELEREGMTMDGFIPVGGKTRKGKALLKRTREIMKS
jgi:hypothetical protein